MIEVLFRLSDLPQEVQNIIIKFTFTFKHPIHLTREQSAVIDCDKCFVAHDSPAPLMAVASAQLLRVSHSFNEIGRAVLFKNNIFVLSDIVTRCDLRRCLQEFPRLRQIQHLEMEMKTASRLGLPSLGAMKGIKSINIVHDSVTIVSRSTRAIVVKGKNEQLREIFVPKAIAKYWHTQDTFDLFFGVRLTIQMVLRVLDEGPEAEEAAKQPATKSEYLFVDLDFLPGNNSVGLDLRKRGFTTLGKSSEDLSVSEARLLADL